MLAELSFKPTIVGISAARRTVAGSKTWWVLVGALYKRGEGQFLAQVLKIVEQFRLRGGKIIRGRDHYRLRPKLLGVTGETHRPCE